ncbi:YfcC family protein [Sneathia sanguinegens]|uniref:YfcC family protein n=1 Tax=Sneathia sanguinegens TaxID=40543 RepID=UPI00288C5245|nr:hypothetical protein [Sneathia sanguinegens]
MKKIKLNAFVLLFFVIVLCILASYVVTPGEFQRQIINGRTIVVANSYHNIPKNFLSPLAIFKAIPYGIMGASNMVVLILLVGGSIEIYNKSGTINAGINKLVNSVGTKGGPLVIAVLFIVFAILGGFLGWIEVCIPFAPLVIPILLALGYDTIVGVSVLVLGLMVGFMVGPTNIYTVGIADQISQLPIFSGLGLRLIIYFIYIPITLIYILWYAQRIRKNPEKSYMKDIDTTDLKVNISKNEPFTSIHKISLIILGLTFIISVYGMLKLKWNIIDMTAVFILSGIIAGLINKMSASDIADSFLVGCKSAFNGAMIVGVARGVQWALEQGKIIDPIIYGMSRMLQGLPSVATAIAVFIVVSFLNGLVPSGSGKAMALMPILMPLSELIGLTRQTMILAYQFGDGLSNIVWFTYGGLLLFLSYGKIPLSKWYKFVFPLILLLAILSAIFLTIAVKISYGPA